MAAAVTAEEAFSARIAKSSDSTSFEQPSVVVNSAYVLVVVLDRARLCKAEEEASNDDFDAPAKIQPP